jgi:hypothetical protein
MTRLLLILTAGMLTVGAAHAANECGAGNHIKDHVYSLPPPPNFDPNPANNPSSKTPACTSPDPQSGAIIEQAFSDAPPPTGLKNDLCALKCIFVSTNNTGNWGKWEDSCCGGDGHTAVIAIDISEFTKKLSDKLKDNQRGKHFGKKHQVDNDTISMSLMYILAHEMGHIKWRKDINRPMPPGPIGSCSVDTFIGYSWTTPGDVKTRRWTAFTEDFGGFRRGNVKHLGDVANLGELLAIYRNGFVTGLAANNAEEDFVETYAMQTLMPPFMYNNNITFEGIAVNSPRGPGGDLQNKFTCGLPLLQ